MTATMVMTVYEYPSFASSGFKLVFFLVVGGLLWFLPVSLCAAEMATVEGWEKGGIYSWVGNTWASDGDFGSVLSMVPDNSWICNNVASSSLLL